MKKRDSEPAELAAWFGRAAAKTAELVGSPWAFLGAVCTVLVWALLGAHFRYSDTWQLVINTGTTIVTFLIVFLIQNTQNRDARALHLKLDEVIRAIGNADNRMIDIEHLSDVELLDLLKKYEGLHAEREHAKTRDTKTG